ncbi:sensor histidine kinase [Pelatocladus sp. BLCC-F211]|uniref:sensor histidine kinase n=1 Tax=Pelatocladus sp. BLCC-F211 TaxID=3342752 RepID=UPI0035B89EB5
MSLSFPVRSNPFRFLLYTEWGLVATCAVANSLIPIVFSQTLDSLIPSFLILLVFGLMGFILPYGKIVYKILYTIIEVGLILFGAALGYLQLWPLLLIVVVIRSSFLFDLSERYLLAGLVFFLFLVLQIQSVSSMTLSLPSSEQGNFWLNQLTHTLLFGTGLLFLLHLVNTVMSERQIQEQLAIAHKQLQQYVVQVEDLAVVRERNHNAHNIHDSLGHALAVMNIQLQTALRFWQVDLEQAYRYIVESKRLGSFAMQEVRRSVNTLRVDVPRERSLQMAITFLVREFHHSTGILPTTQLTLAFILPREVSKILYLLVQEALTNIYKHAEATAVHIQLSAIPEQVYLTIEDNGRGFQLDQQSIGFGLQEMQQRVALLKGQFQIESELGSGCCLSVRLPLSEFSTNIPLELAPVPDRKNPTLQKGFV